MTKADYSTLQRIIKVETVDLSTGNVSSRFVETGLGKKFLKTVLLPAKLDMEERGKKRSLIMTDGRAILVWRYRLELAKGGHVVRWRLQFNFGIAEKLRDRVIDKVTAAFFEMGSDRVEIIRDNNEQGNLVILVDEPL